MWAVEVGAGGGNDAGGTQPRLFVSTFYLHVHVSLLFFWGKRILPRYTFISINKKTLHSFSISAEPHHIQGDGVLRLRKSCKA